MGERAVSVSSFSAWLYGTAVSQAIQNTSWVIPVTQSIHIIAIASLFGSAIVLDLKLAGIIARTDSAVVVFRRYMPWLWAGLAVLVATGIVMVIGEPERALTNWVFWLKMSLVLVGFVLTLIMRVPMLRADLEGVSAVWSNLSKPLGFLAIAIWIAVIFCGRWIAYAI